MSESWILFQVGLPAVISGFQTASLPRSLTSSKWHWFTITSVSTPYWSHQPRYFSKQEIDASYHSKMPVMNFCRWVCLRKGDVIRSDASRLIQVEKGTIMLEKVAPPHFDVYQNTGWSVGVKVSYTFANIIVCWKEGKRRLVIKTSEVRHHNTPVPGTLWYLVRRPRFTIKRIRTVVSGLNCVMPIETSRLAACLYW